MSGRRVVSYLTVRLLQRDGSAIHTYTAGQAGVVMARNWAIGNRRGGFRFDMGVEGDDGCYVAGVNGTIHHSVAYGNGYYGTQLKGDYNRIVALTAAGHDSSNDMSVSRTYPTVAPDRCRLNNHSKVLASSSF